MIEQGNLSRGLGINFLVQREIEEMNRTKKAWIIWGTLSGPELIFHILFAHKLSLSSTLKYQQAEWNLTCGPASKNILPVISPVDNSLLRSHLMIYNSCNDESGKSRAQCLQVKPCRYGIIVFCLSRKFSLSLWKWWSCRNKLGCAFDYALYIQAIKNPSPVRINLVISIRNI